MRLFVTCYVCSIYGQLVQLDKVVQNLSLTLAKVMNDTTSAFEGIQVNINSSSTHCYGQNNCPIFPP